jgi:hypothetical protein
MAIVNASTVLPTPSRFLLVRLRLLVQRMPKAIQVLERFLNTVLAAF